MRKSFILALSFALLAAAAPGRPDEATRRRLVQYFQGWYSVFPGSRVSAIETTEVALPGLETYRVDRHSDSKSHQESNIAFYDRARDEVFVGDAFHDPDRSAARTAFDPDRDLANIRASLAEAFGLPVKVSVGPTPRGALLPLTVAIEQMRGAVATRQGFVSKDGATLMLGEFHPLSQSPEAFRQGLLAQRPGIRSRGGGAFTVVEFLDFQCERCRKRTPEVRLAAWERGGTVETRMLPLVKMHDWAFPAAECAAALAPSGPELFARYEEALFARQEKMTAAAATELAADIAEAAGARAKYEGELASGRAREHVLSDITLAIRLGIIGTPSFVESGAFVSGEHGILEKYLAEKFPARSPSPSPGRIP